MKDDITNPFVSNNPQPAAPPVQPPMNSPFGQPVPPAQPAPSVPPMPPQPPQPPVAPVPPMSGPQPNQMQYQSQPVYPGNQYSNQSAMEDHYGLKGWLMFFLIIFIIGGLGNIFTFIMGIAGIIDDGAEAQSIFNLMSSLVMAGLTLASAGLIASRRKMGINMAVSTMIASAVLSVIGTIISINNLLSVTTYSYSSYFTSKVNSTAIGMLVATCIVQLIYNGIVIAYFKKSVRVKNTLTQ